MENFDKFFYITHEEQQVAMAIDFDRQQVAMVNGWGLQ